MSGSRFNEEEKKRSDLVTLTLCVIDNCTDSVMNKPLVWTFTCGHRVIIDVFAD